ncbi:MAG: HAMP domain-containing protein [Microscillaceae bacterium]|nr:HAMP domain-containing protein [Microscillaceae bacterium]
MQESGYRVAFYLALLGMLGLIGGTVLVFTLPGYLANPLLELNEKIQAVMAENYDHKLELRYHAKDEVGELAASINKMAIQLKNYERSRLAQLWHENQLDEAALDALPLGLLVLDTQYQLRQSNQKARIWLGITAEDMKNTPSIMVLAAQNPALGRLWNAFGQEEEEFLAADTPAEKYGWKKI